MWVPSEDMRLGRVEAGDIGPWWEKEDEEEVKEERDEWEGGLEGREGGLEGLVGVVALGGREEGPDW